MWIITKDHFEGKASGICSRNHEESQAENLVHPFRMYDDDKKLVYERLSDSNDSQRAFAPLDDFGKPSYGCTEIHYLTNGVWEQL